LAAAGAATPGFASSSSPSIAAAYRDSVGVERRLVWKSAAGKGPAQALPLRGGCPNT